jgi:hypothetical protein
MSEPGAIMEIEVKGSVLSEKCHLTKGEEANWLTKELKNSQTSQTQTQNNHIIASREKFQKDGTMGVA